MKKTASSFALCCIFMVFGCGGDDSESKATSADSGISSGNGLEAGVQNPSPDGSNNVVQGDGFINVSGQDGGATVVNPPPVTSDPMICKSCSSYADCPDTGSNSYMCLTYTWAPGTPEEKKEQYCALKCDAVTCPAGFACETVGDSSGGTSYKLCIPQPHGLCSEVTTPVTDGGTVVQDAGTTPVTDTSTAPVADALVVPNDPTICGFCKSSNGNADCIDQTGMGYEYLCISAWTTATGTKIADEFCARRCESVACPTSFICETVSSSDGSFTAKYCKPQPYGICHMP